MKTNSSRKMRHAEREALRKHTEEKSRKMFFTIIRKEESEHQKLVNQKK
jgi:hypothetical protein